MDEGERRAKEGEGKGKGERSGVRYGPLRGRDGERILPKCAN